MLTEKHVNPARRTNIIRLRIDSLLSEYFFLFSSATGEETYTEHCSRKSDHSWWKWNSRYCKRIATTISKEVPCYGKCFISSS